MSQTVVLKVGMDCQGCAGAVKRALGKMEGVESFDINLKEKKVTVKGNVQPEAVLQTVAKTGKTTAFWEAEAPAKPENKPQVTEAAPAEPENKPQVTEAAPAEPENKPEVTEAALAKPEIKPSIELAEPENKPQVTEAAPAEPENKPEATGAAVAKPEIKPSIESVEPENKPSETVTVA